MIKTQKKSNSYKIYFTKRKILFYKMQKNTLCRWRCCGPTVVKLLSHDPEQRSTESVIGLYKGNTVVRTAVPAIGSITDVVTKHP